MEDVVTEDAVGLKLLMCNCGEEPNIKYAGYTDTYYVSCSVCNNCGGSFYGKAEAVKNWNDQLERSREPHNLAKLKHNSDVQTCKDTDGKKENKDNEEMKDTVSVSPMQKKV